MADGGLVRPGRVSIIIPTHDDDPTHLDEAVRSAGAQTHPDVEIIVVDDGSTVAARPPRIGGSTPLQLVRQTNRGPAAARNTGIRTASGEYVICLDADDRIDVTFAAEGLELLTRDPTCTIAYPAMVPFGDPEAPAWPTRGALTLRDFAQRSAVPVPSVFRRADGDAAGGWDEQMRTGMEDHEWWVRLLGAVGGRALPMPSATLHYRIRPSSRSRLRPYADDLEVTRRHILANNPPHVIRELLEGAWSATDTVERSAADAWSDPWQLRRWGRALRRRTRRLTRRGTAND